MSVDKLVDSTQLDADLTSVANAIRTKGGTSSPLVFPAGFVSAIQAIPTSGGTDYLPAICANTVTVLNDPLITHIDRDFAFRSCTALETVSLENLTTAGHIGTAFYGCTNLVEVHLPNLGDAYPTSNSSATFQGCTKLALVDLGGWKRLGGNEFTGCTVLTTLILRRTSGITELATTGAFGNTPFASGGSGGTLYVPQALIASYQNASNWSTILGYANNQIKKIEGSIYEI